MTYALLTLLILIVAYLPARTWWRRRQPDHYKPDDIRGV